MTEKELASLFEELELRLIASLKRNLSTHKAWEQDLGFDWTAWQAEKIRALERFRKENESILREYRDTISKETRKLLEEQFAEGQTREADELGEATDDSFFELFDEKLDKQTALEKSRFTRLHKAVGDSERIQRSGKTAVRRTERRIVSLHALRGRRSDEQIPRRRA